MNDDFFFFGCENRASYLENPVFEKRVQDSVRRRIEEDDFRSSRRRENKKVQNSRIQMD